MNDNTGFVFRVLILILLILWGCDKLPTKDSVNTIPEYYFTEGYLDERIKVINTTLKNCSDNSEAFFWITDMHWEPDLNTRHSPALIKYIASNAGISKVLNGGDIGNSQIICSNAINRLRDAIGSNMVYSVNGNHEIYDASQYETPFERVYKTLRDHCNDITFGNQNKSYFYFDDLKSKTRNIGLSTYGLYLNNSYASEYGEEQLKWFQQVALNVEDKWTIVIFTHCLYYVDINSNLLYTTPLVLKRL